MTSQLWKNEANDVWRVRICQSVHLSELWIIQSSDDLHIIFSYHNASVQMLNVTSNFLFTSNLLHVVSLVNFIYFFLSLKLLALATVLTFLFILQQLHKVSHVPGLLVYAQMANKEPKLRTLNLDSLMAVKKHKIILWSGSNKDSDNRDQGTPCLIKATECINGVTANVHFDCIRLNRFYTHHTFPVKSTV